MSRTLIDISYPIEPAMPVLPNYAPVVVEILDSTAHQEPHGSRHLNSSRLTIGLHTGTHMDSPFHFFGEGKTFEDIPLEQCVGEAVLIRLPNHMAFAPITPEDIQPYQAAIRETGKVVFDTGWYRYWGDPAFFLDHPAITLEAAELLIAWGAHLIGVDFPSVDRAPYPAHLTFLGNGAVIVENLTNLDALSSERFHLTALPLNLVGRDGCPVRAIAKETP